MSEQQNPTVATKPNEVPKIPQVPADWAALGAKAGYNPRAAEDLRIWIEGPFGKGKTTFNASIPNQLILDFEGGACAVVGGRAVPIFIQDYDHYNAVTDKLLDDAKKGKRAWKRICIDTADVWIEMTKLQLEKERGVEDIHEFGTKGKGYTMIQNRCWGKIRELESAGYAWTIIGHLRMKEETNPATNQTVVRPRPSIYPGFAGRIKGNSDFCLTVYSRPVKVTETIQKKLNGKVVSIPGKEKIIEKYYVDTRHTTDKEGKTRGVSSMPRKTEVPEIGGWDVFKDAYEAAVEAARKEHQCT